MARAVGARQSTHGMRNTDSCVRADARTPKFVKQFRVCGYRWRAFVCCWQEAIGTILRIAVLGRGMRIIRCRMRMRIMARAVGYG